MNTLNLRGDVRPVHTPLQLIREGSVSEHSDSYTTGYELPQPDAYARHIAEEAEAWLDFMRERSRMKDETLVRKALHAVAFSLRHGAHDLAIPSKLSGTAKHQRVLWQMIRERVPLGASLDMHEDGKRIIVSYGGEEIGEVQRKHTGWLRPLVPFGAGLHLVRVTGSEGEGYRLGCNVAVGRAGRAVTALRHALGRDVGGDGYGGEEAAQIALRMRPGTA